MATGRRRTYAWTSVAVAISLLFLAVVPVLFAAQATGWSDVPGFAWPHARSAPNAWTHATISSGNATLFYPGSWKPLPGDAGTVTAAVRDGRGLYRGYLNVTPRQGAERPHGWARFRTRRNRLEGDGNVRQLAAAEHLRFADAEGSCVIDDYRSRVGAHPYRELACIVAGHRATSVFVGAVLRRDWARLGPVVARAASALRQR